MSAPRLHAPEFLQAEGAIVDVRSPSEFAEGHIPGAVNIALFTDEERAKVGTLYKQQSREAAIDAGFEIAGPKMKTFADQARGVADDEGLRVYCWRGGMRSGHMSWLFETAGVQTCVLEGGYKAYRKLMMKQFEAITKLVVLQGPTGAGKTELLCALRDLGEQVIDLEGLANHKGSAFGALGMEAQPSSQQFQNLIFETLNAFDIDKPIWVESESKTIGRAYLPDPLWEKMNHSKLLEIQVPKQDRVDRLVRDYGKFESAALTDSVKRLERRLGGARVQELVDLILEGKLDLTAAHLLDYYDESYRYSREKYKRTEAVQLDFTDVTFAQIPEKLLNEVKTWNW